MNLSDAVRAVGVHDETLDLFENQYAVNRGVSYNSYVILDEKVALMDTVDLRVLEAWSSRLDSALNGRPVDYIVVQHMEPDHSGALAWALEKFPGAVVVATAKTFVFIRQFFGLTLEGRMLEVQEGDTLSLGRHCLQFLMAPMLHWPEVMVTYEQTEGLLFSADGFGRFGAPDPSEPWEDEARRYYFNIVGKYGPSVQALLKKAAGLDIRAILPLHGPVLDGDLSRYLRLYDTWSRYIPEESGVLVAHASIHGNTRAAAEKLADLLRALGAAVAVADLCRDDPAQCVAQAFRYDRLVLCAATYDGGAFVPMEDFLHHLKCKAFQNRTAALVENGTWAPAAARAMRGCLEAMKQITVLDESVTIRSTCRPEDDAALEALARAVAAAGA